MQTLLGKTLEEISETVISLGAKKFVGQQICDWIYKKNASDISDMTNISSSVRNSLSKEYSVGITDYIKEVISKDGTRKYLFAYPDDVFVEAVLIFDGTRVTLCISTQAGCRMNCAFCATGQQGLLRNLTSNEIINIFSVLNRRCASFNQPLKIDNIVFMGMGEPLDNFEEVQKVINVLTSSWGYAVSPRRITVSTAGFIPNLKRFLDCTQTDVAISLHNAISDERKDIMPIEKAFPVSDVVRILRQYDWSHQRHLTFEYIVLHDTNTTNRHVNAVARLLNGIPCRINLIPFNDISDKRFTGATKSETELFASKLRSKGFTVTVRASKGQDISAACGLLSTKHINATNIPAKD